MSDTLAQFPKYPGPPPPETIKRPKRLVVAAWLVFLVGILAAVIAAGEVTSLMEEDSQSPQSTEGPPFEGFGVLIMFLVLCGYILTPPVLGVVIGIGVFRGNSDMRIVASICAGFLLIKEAATITSLAASAPVPENWWQLLLSVAAPIAMGITVIALFLLWSQKSRNYFKEVEYRERFFA